MYQSQVNMCFLRGPPRWLTEQKNPKFLWSLQITQRDTTNMAIKIEARKKIFLYTDTGIIIASETFPGAPTDCFL